MADRRVNGCKSARTPGTGRVVTERPSVRSLVRQPSLLGAKQNAAGHVNNELNKLEALISQALVNPHLITTAEHGGCFGEGGYFGHGPIKHEKVTEVPFPGRQEA